MINSKDLIFYAKDLHILFAEDHKELRENTSDILRNFFKTVTSVKDGKEALELYKNNINSYDIILSDIQMPKINGVDLTKEIYKVNPHQTIIILSAYDESKYLLPLVNLGIEHFIKKPINYPEFMSVLLKTSKKLSKSIPNTSINTNNLVNITNECVFDITNSALLQNNENLYITKYEIIFLQLLCGNIGKIFSNDDIVNYYLSQNEKIDSQNIRKLVSKLRKKLPQDSLESIYSVGYKIKKT